MHEGLIDVNVGACLYLSAHSLLYLHVSICRHISRDNEEFKYSKLICG